MGTVIVGIDETPTAAEAAETAAAMAAAMGSSLTLVMAHGAAPTFFLDGPGTDAWDLPAGSDATNTATRVKAELKLVVDDIEIEIAAGKPADVLVETAERLDASLIVVGNRRVQSKARVLGAIASSVIQRAPCDVYVAKTH